MGKYIVLLILVLFLLVVVACSTSKSKEETNTELEEITYTKNSGGNQRLPESPYGYEMWTEGGNDNKLIWYGPNQKGGAAFRAEWKNPHDFLGRVGYYWNQGKPYTYYKNLYCDFEFTRSANKTAGNYSYIGIYGWSKNPMIEYYIVEDWYGNQWQPNADPITTNTTGGSVIDTFTVDGAVYNIIKSTRVEKPSLEGIKTFDQYFSIRLTPRKAGTISITEHFKKWESLGLVLGTNMYECKFLVEAAGGVGWFDASYLSFYQKDE